jgi:hypothetical protein
VLALMVRNLLLIVVTVAIAMSTRFREDLYQIPGSSILRSSG